MEIVCEVFIDMLLLRKGSQNLGVSLVFTLIDEKRN
jgi:hypothetical protein